MKTVVVGTAGHVDHGKTALVRALTGIDTDRMAEEKRRGISIDIGFAHVELEGGTVLDFVDVPGHERFVRNMLCGATGVDLAILAIAADDGVMPQTKEHFDILRLIGVKKGLIVLTKVDLVDEETREMAELEISEMVEGSFLEGAPILHFSAVTGEGADAVLKCLGELARSIPTRRTDTSFRLPVDKVYKSQGRGTVVTGTVAGGTVKVGDDLAIFPAGLPGKARSIQAHRRELQVAQAGQRVGINIAGVDADAVSRGSVVATPGTVAVSRMVNVEFAMLPSADRSLKQRERVKVYVGTQELVCRVVLLDREALDPGDTALAQLRCEGELVAVPGDGFVARSLSPSRTVGGGKILQVAARKYRRFDSRVLRELKTLDLGDDLSLVESALRARGYELSSAADLVPLCGLAPERVERVVAELSEKGRALKVGCGFILAESFAELKAIIERILIEECERRALLRRFRIAEIRGKLAFEIDTELLEEALKHLEKSGTLQIAGNEIIVRKYEVRLTPKQAEIAKVAMDLCRTSPAPVRLTSLEAACPRSASEARSVLRYLASEGNLILFKDFSFLDAKRYEEIKAILREHLSRRGEITLAQARDLIGIGRNPLQTILERLDEEGFTERRGDVRVLIEGRGSHGALARIKGA